MAAPAEQTKSIIEVAKLAGVSTATVSRVLNGLPGVREQTIAQVKAAVEKLKYRRLRTRSTRARPKKAHKFKLRTGTIALITLGHDRSWLELPVMASVLGGIQRGANAHDLRLILHEMPDPTKPGSILLDGQIDGAILLLSSEVPIATYDAMFKLIQKYTPIVWVMGMEMAISGVDHVAPDNVGIGYLAYTYLKNLGCQRPAFVTANPNWPLMRLRGQSFLNSAFDAGLQPVTYAVAEDKRVLQPYGGQVVSADRLTDLIEKLAKADPRPDGIFVGNDFTLSYVYPMLVQHGIRIGVDMQIISCDAENARLAGMHPRPASIDIGGDEIGYRSVHRLLNRIERSNGLPLIIQVAPRLQVPPPAP